MRGLSGKTAILFDELERRFIYGTYKFGEIIPTANIAKEFDVSRATLTMALNHLRFEGYIEIVPQVGSRVVTPSDRQVHDYFIMFSLIEHQMARFAAERRTPESLRDIEDICQRITAMSERIVVPNYEFIDLIDLYHMAIRRAADSVMEVQRASGYFRFAAFFLMNGKTINFSDVVRHSNRNRPFVTKYIAEGNVELAGEAMKKYILTGAPLDQTNARVG